MADNSVGVKSHTFEYIFIYLLLCKRQFRQHGWKILFRFRRERRRTHRAVMARVAVRLHTGCYITRNTLYHVGYMVQDTKVREHKPFTIHTLDITHDDVIKWKHFPRYRLFVRGIHQSPVNSPHKVHWRGAFMFSMICAWMKGWVNNRDARDLRSRDAHYDVIVMENFTIFSPICSVVKDMYSH